MTPPKKELIAAIVGFGISLILTGYFIEAYDGYISMHQTLLSGGIAGGKWAIQLSLAWFILGDKKWRYYKEMGTICAVGSSILIPFIIWPGGWEYFLSSLSASVLVMASLVCWRLQRIPLNKWWVLLWFGFLAIAVALQLLIVFRVHL